MKKIKRFLVGLLACVCIGAGVTGLVSCGTITVNPNNQGGVTITPNTPPNSSSIQQPSDSSAGQTHVHDWTVETVVTEVSCTVSGVKILVCNCGEDKIETTPALGHDRLRIFAKAPTCTEFGWNTYEKCQRDGCEYTTYEKIDALGHDNVEHTAQAATCTDFGWDAYTVCNRCHVSTYQQIPAKGHTYEQGECNCGAVEPGHTHLWNEGEVTKEPNCTQTGVKKFTCTVSNCGETKTEEMAALGHSNTEYVAKAATCTEIGWSAYTVCERCNYSTYMEVPAIGHSFGSGVITKAATCTESGVMTFSCFCKESYTQPIALLGHNYGEWFVFDEATCEEIGEERRICAHDSAHIEKRDIAKIGHKYGVWNTVVEPTCGQEGEEKRVCENDPTHVQTRSIPVTGEHNVNIETGVCAICKETIKQRLSTIESTEIKADEKGISWGIVTGAERYQVKITYGSSATIEETSETLIDLTNFFAGNKELFIQIRAIATVESGYAHSFWSSIYTYEIHGESITLTNGIGKTIDLRTGNYTSFNTQKSPIFDLTEFSKLRVEKKIMNELNSMVSYGDDMKSYLDDESLNITTKINASVSGQVRKIKAHAKYDFEISALYAKKSQSETKTAFFDMNSYYLANELTIAGVAGNKDLLQNALSSEFKAALLAVETGIMTPKAFVDAYGTHVIVSAIYGAKFNVHYDMITTKSANEVSGDVSTKMGIQASVEAAMNKSLNASASGNTDLSSKYAWLQNNNAANQQTRFKVTATGGKNTTFDSLESFASGYKEWTESVNENKDKGELPLIEISDGGLYCIWHLVYGHSNAKEALDDYLENECKVSYDAIRNKMNEAYYTDFVEFDEDTQVMTVNFKGLQQHSGAVDLSAIISYGKWYDSNTGVFTVTPKYPVMDKTGNEKGVDIKKIVFKGGYQEADASGIVFKHGFTNFSIKFHPDWKENIEIEFDSFSYTAKVGQVGLDLSQVGSEKITINVVGNAYIKGGDGASSGAAGLAGVLATNKNLTIKGDGEWTVVGGNGAKGALTGIDGASKGDAPDRTWGYRGDDGASGSNGGNGAGALYCNNITLISGTITLTGGTGGDGTNGGNGGHGGKGGDYGMPGGDGGNGGHGGNGGAGGDSIVGKNVSILGGKMLLNGGDTGTCGSGGHGGDGGRGGWQTGVAAYKSGNGGNGGKGGDGGYAGSAGNSNISSLNISYKDATAVTIKKGKQAIRGYYGYGGSGGKYGSTDMWAGNGNWGATGANGSGSTPI